MNNTDLSGSAMAEGREILNLNETRGTKEFFRRHRSKLAVGVVTISGIGLLAFFYGGARIRSTFEEMYGQLTAEKQIAQAKADSLDSVATDAQSRLSERNARVEALEGENRDYSRNLASERRKTRSLTDSVESQRRSIGMESEEARREALSYAFSLFPEGPKRFEPTRTQTNTYLRFRPNREGTGLLNVPLTERILETVQTRDENLRAQEIELAKLGVRTGDITSYRRGEVEIVLVNNPLDRDRYNVDVRTLEGKSIQAYISTKR